MGETFRPWFERYPERLKSEEAILEEAGFVRFHGLEKFPELIAFSGTLPVDPQRELLIVFPEAFPSMPPKVFDKGPLPVLARHHHPGNRQFCLFGNVNARWTAGLSCREVLHEVTNLIEQFGKPGPIVNEDTVPEPLTAALPYAPGGSILVPPSISELGFLGPAITKGELTLRYMEPNRLRRAGQGIVLNATIGSHSFKANDGFREILGPDGPEFRVPLVYLPAVATMEELGEAAKTAIKSDIYGAKKKQRWFAFLFPEKSGAADAVRFSWAFAKVDAQGSVQWVQAFPYRSDERMARIPQLRGLEAHTVAFLGCGCLGSKIALNLAASGLKNFTLIDFENVEPYNTVRQEVTINSFGFKKVDAFGMRLSQVNPEVSINPLAFCIGEANNATSERDAFAAFAKSSLIVDTIGNHGVSRWLNDLASDLAVPAIFASVTNGAWGGEIVRYRPGSSGCWRCWNSEYYDSRPPEEPSNGFYAPGCNQTSFTGTTYDAEMVASIASSLIADTLLPDGPNNNRFAGDYIKWSGRDSAGPIFRAEFLPVNSRPDCPFCGNSRRCDE